MPYLGKSLAGSSSIRRFNVTSSTSATHTLTWAPPTEQSIIVSINGVKQHEDAYSISGTTLTLTNALVATDKMEVIGINDVGTTVTAAQGSVNTDKLADDAVTTAKIANDQVTTAKIADDQITTAKIANDQVTTAKIADDQITTAKIADDSIQSLKNRNRIINGDMRIDQRNGGAAVTGLGGSAGVYSLDRFRNGFTATTARYSIQQVADAPGGFYNSLKVTITTDESSLAAGSASAIGQIIEGFNCYDIKTTGAQKPTAFSFWVKSSKTGTFVVEFGDVPNARGVSATYTINSANTWEYKTIAFPADTGATWTASNASAGILQFMLFAGSDFTSGTLQTTWASYTNANRCVGQSNLADTNGATFYITGVQLEVGSVATPFEHEFYGQALQKCFRYYYKTDNLGVGIGTNSTSINVRTSFNVFMRTSPTASVAGTNWEVSDDYSADVTAATPTIGTTYTVSNSSWRGRLEGFSGIGTGRFYGCKPSSTSLIAFDAEL